MYQQSHSFVWELGRDLVALLEPRPGEPVLDLLGVDHSEAMIEQARRNFPDLRFEVAEAAALPYRERFDAVFSNAVLHWIADADVAAEGVRRALKTGGRFVAGFGGHGNVRRLLEAVFAALEGLGVPRRHPWYFPTIGEYAASWRTTGWR